MHRKHINEIIDSNDNEKMHDLKNVLIDTISYMKQIDPRTYEQIEYDLKEIAERKSFKNNL